VSTIRDHIHHHEDEASVRRILGVLSLAKKHEPAVVQYATKAPSISASRRIAFRAAISNGHPCRLPSGGSFRSFGSSASTATSSIPRQETSDESDRTRSRPSASAPAVLEMRLRRAHAGDAAAKTHHTAATAMCSAMFAEVSASRRSNPHFASSASALYNGHLTTESLDAVASSVLSRVQTPAVTVRTWYAVGFTRDNVGIT
jgi:hypothetical protein